MCESLDRMREEARAEGKIQGEKTALKNFNKLIKERNIGFLYFGNHRSFF